MKTARRAAIEWADAEGIEDVRQRAAYSAGWQAALVEYRPLPHQGVHNHGPNSGEGLECPETITGRCLRSDGGGDGLYALRQANLEALRRGALGVSAFLTQYIQEEETRARSGN